VVVKEYYKGDKNMNYDISLSEDEKEMLIKVFENSIFRKEWVLREKCETSEVIKRRNLRNCAERERQFLERLRMLTYK